MGNRWLFLEIPDRQNYLSGYFILIHSRLNAMNANMHISRILDENSESVWETLY